MNRRCSNAYNDATGREKMRGKKKERKRERKKSFKEGRDTPGASYPRVAYRWSDLISRKTGRFKRRLISPSCSTVDCPSYISKVHPEYTMLIDSAKKMYYASRENSSTYVHGKRNALHVTVHVLRHSTASVPRTKYLTTSLVIKQIDIKYNTKKSKK